MNILGIENIPQEAKDLFGRREELFEVVQLYNRIVQWYNALRVNTLDVEFNLIKEEIDEVDRGLQKATTELTWVTDSKFFFKFFFMK